MSTQETLQNPFYLRALADRLKASWQEQSAKPINQSLADALKGTLRGVTADFLGAPVDMATAYLAPPESGNPYANAIRGLFGGGATPVGGSDWWAGKMNLPEAQGLAYEAGRMLAPNPFEFAKFAKSARPAMRVVESAEVLPGPYHRFTNDGPMSRNGYAMFSDNIADVENGYGQNHYSFDPSSLPQKATVFAGNENLKSMIENAIAEHGGDYAEEAAALANEINPHRIVDSAGIWDNEDLVSLIYQHVLEPNGWSAVETNDGAILFDPAAVRHHPKK